MKINSRCIVEVQAQHSAYTLKLVCYTLPSITSNLPSIKIDVQNLNIPTTVRLADPSFFKPDKIDILMGAEVFWNLICVSQNSLGPERPILQKSRFGWLISGTVYEKSSKPIACNFTQDNLQKLLARFWELEDITTKRILSQEESTCEKHFVEHTKQAADGRFIVTLPLKDSVDKLGESRDQAERRFLVLERKLNNNETLKAQYTKFMEEYILSEHMSEVDIEDTNQTSYYMPHHGVLKQDSRTTKLRVVFDCSARTSTGLSLNDLEMVGPAIQPELLTLLIRFRQHEIVVCGDIKKMYRQCVLDPSQRSLQRLFWRSNPTENLKVHEMNRLTYGNASAPFLAIRCLQEISNIHKETHPEAAKIIASDFYVDDLLTGFDSTESAMKTCKDITALLASGCFKIWKFYSNHPEILELLRDNENENHILTFGEQETAKTLGLAWIPISDNLVYRITTEKNNRLTKRVILSRIAKIFDPLGLLSPCTIIAKLIMQKLWLEKLTWDKTLPLSIHTKWIEFDNALLELNNLKISRLTTCRKAKRIELHGFSDASESAYGCYIYLHSRNDNGETKTSLLCAKSRVAPLKIVSLPRLELCGAVMMAKLMRYVTQ